MSIRDSIIGAQSLLAEGLKKLDEALGQLADSPPPPAPSPPPPVPSPLPAPPPSPLPVTAIPFRITDSMSVLRSSEYASIAVPLAESLAATDVSRLAVRVKSGSAGAGGGAYIPADIRPTAWWRTKANPTAIQWVLVSVPVSLSISAKGVLDCELVVGVEKGTNPPPPRPLLVLAAGLGAGPSALTVDTGVARYTVSAIGLAGSLADGSPVFTSQGLSGTFEHLDIASTSLRALTIEYRGPLVAIIVVEGKTNLSFGGGAISFRRRYEFRAGESYVEVGERLAWEGTLADSSEVKKDGSWNAVLGTLIRESFQLSAAPESVDLYPEATVITATADTSAGVLSASLEQQLRPTRLDADAKGNKTAHPQSYVARVGDKTVSGTAAFGGMLFARNKVGSLAVALRKMHRYEPQALRLDGNFLRLDLASDKFWLAHHQAVFVKYSLAATSDPGFDMPRFWRGLNAPLRGLVDPQYLYTSGAVRSIPTGVLAPDLVPYDVALRNLLDSTLRWRGLEGLSGLMTWGLFPRYWGEYHVGDGETGSGTGAWDELYLRTTWTDYWNTSTSAVHAAYRFGEPKWIDEISLPAAERMLHTQILQGAPASEDHWFYLGQAAYGYGLYRSDFNSSHQYWENLYWYYLLTGDRLAVDLIERGMRNQIPFIRTQGSVSGRQPHQWIMACRFLAHTSLATDLDFGAIFEEFVTRAIRECYVIGDWQGNQEAFWAESKVAAGTFNSQQLWSVGYYDLENVYWLGVRTGNAPVTGTTNGTGSSVRPFDVIASTAETMMRLGLKLSAGDGTVAGQITRIFSLTWNGTKFTNVVAGVKDGESLQYNDDKPAMSAWWARAAYFRPALAPKAKELIAFSFTRLANRGVPMSKLMGLAHTRLVTAIAVVGEGKI